MGHNSSLCYSSKSYPSDLVSLFFVSFSLCFFLAFSSVAFSFFGQYILDFDT